MCVVVGGPGSAIAAPKADIDPDRARVGPIDVSIEGRRRVRGGRPDGASIHLAWAPGIDDPDRADREALAAFERATFPADRSHQTIISKPPAGWMSDLKSPSLPIRWNQRTVAYLEYFRDDPRGQRMMQGWIRRAGRYETTLRKILEEVGVPSDLVMVALAESGFNPTVRSRVGAAGLWQFMEGTGSVYGLDRDYWVDERFDIEKSTYAAALYLKDLQVRFGSWELALAAFNAGYGLLMTTIERHNTNNYWALCEIESGLPYATTNYVPKIMAAALVSANRDAFGVGRNDVEPYPAVDWVNVRVSRSTSLKHLAKTIGEDPDLLYELNAHLIRKRTPPRRNGFSVRIPRDKVSAFERSQPALRKQWSTETTYDVRHGESLEAIASAHGLTTRELRRLNSIEDSAEVRGGVTLIVPSSVEIPPRDTKVASAPAELPLAAVPPLSPPRGKRRVFFVTNRASTPRTLERAFGVRYSDIVAWNDLDPHARLQADQVLQVFVPRDYDEKKHDVELREESEVELVVRGSREHLEAALRRRGMQRRAYQVKSGDTLERIGRKFGLSTGDMARINGVPRTHEPAVGDLLVVYVQPHKARLTVEAPDPQPLTASTSRHTASTANTSRVPGKKKR
jgi:membrane-bound lytic murein transglycosylase D